jgi:signal transduction histidine kinase
MTLPNPFANDDEHERRRIIGTRTVFVLLIPIFVSVISFLILRTFIQRPLEGAPPMPPGDSPLIPIAVLVVFFSALIVLLRIGKPTVSAILLIGFWTLATTGGSLRAGVASYFPAMLIIPICAAGLLIDRVASLSLAALASILVLSIAWLETSGGITPMPVPPVLLSIQPLFALGFWIGLFWTIAALTSLFAGGLHQALQRSRAQAAELEKLRDQLEARVAAQTEQIRLQEREAATLEERTRLAREIHDTIAQGLTGVVVQIGAVQRALHAAPEEAPDHLLLAQRMAREALAEARRSVWNLRSPALEQAELGDALRGVVERQAAMLPGSSFHEEGQRRPLEAPIESALLRVGQEALANASKHAQTAAQIVLRYESEAITLTIRDNGPGFPSEVLERPVIPGPWGGFGLLGMRERLMALGGELRLSNNRGAVVEASIPLPKEAA